MEMAPCDAGPRIRSLNLDLGCVRVMCSCVCICLCVCVLKGNLVYDPLKTFISMEWKRSEPQYFFLWIQNIGISSHPPFLSHHREREYKPKKYNPSPSVIWLLSDWILTLFSRALLAFREGCCQEWRGRETCRQGRERRLHFVGGWAQEKGRIQVSFQEHISSPVLCFIEMIC